MSLADSKGSLSRAAKDLFARWEDVKAVWSDAQAKSFEATVLRQIEDDVRSALGAMDTMGQILFKIEHECE
jgi:hypothetical protein